MSDTSIDAPFAVQPAFRIRDIFSKSFRLFGQGWGSFVIVMGVAQLVTLPHALYVAGLDRQTMAKALISMGPLSIGRASSVIVLCLVYPIPQAMVLKMAFRALRGDNLDMKRALREVFPRSLPLAGTTLYVSLLSGLGTLLLIIPGIMVFLAGSIAIQVCAAEPLGPAAAFKRSAFLTRGHRWKILGIMVVISVVAAGVPAIIKSAVTPALGPKIAVLFASPADVLIGAFGAILLSVIYHDLRVAKEGRDSDRIAGVFD